MMDACEYLLLFALIVRNLEERQDDIRSVSPCAYLLKTMGEMNWIGKKTIIDLHIVRQELGQKETS